MFLKTKGRSSAVRRQAGLFAQQKIVPCGVTAQNGAVEIGDLRVCPALPGPRLTNTRFWPREPERKRSGITGG